MSIVCRNLSKDFDIDHYIFFRKQPPFKTYFQLLSNNKYIPLCQVCNSNYSTAHQEHFLGKDAGLLPIKTDVTTIHIA